MVTELLVGIIALFLLMGHSTLLYFKVKEMPQISIGQMFFPWPIFGGKTVAFLSFFISGIFLYILFVFGYFNSISWRIILFISPEIIYISQLLRGIRSDDSGFYYDSQYKSSAMWKLILFYLSFLFVFSILIKG